MNDRRIVAQMRLAARHDGNSITQEINNSPTIDLSDVGQRGDHAVFTDMDGVAHHVSRHDVVEVTKISPHSSFSLYFTSYSAGDAVGNSPQDSLEHRNKINGMHTASNIMRGISLSKDAQDTVDNARNGSKAATPASAPAPITAVS